MKSDTATQMKELLSDPKNRIKLDDFVTERVKAYLDVTKLENFPVQSVSAQKEEFLERIQKYEEAVRDLQDIVILLARWGERQQLLLLEKVFVRVAEADKGSSGTILWLRLGWYPLFLLMYSAGISALSARNLDALKIALTTRVPYKKGDANEQSLVVCVTGELSDLHESWKLLPGHERKHVPRSEHLFEVLHEPLERLLFLGESYESFFDRFEVYAAFAYMDETNREWGPVGRFGWKHNRGYGDSPYTALLNEAKKEGVSWSALEVGLFRGSQERFTELSTALTALLGKISWF